MTAEWKKMSKDIIQIAQDERERIDSEMDIREIGIYDPDEMTVKEKIRSLIAVVLMGLMVAGCVVGVDKCLYSNQQNDEQIP